MKNRIYLNVLMIIRGCFWLLFVPNRFNPGNFLDRSPLYRSLGSVPVNGGEIIVETGKPVRVPAPFCLSPTLISWEIESFLPPFLLINYDEKSMKIPSLKNMGEKVGLSVSYPNMVDPGIHENSARILPSSRGDLRSP